MPNQIQKVNEPLISPGTATTNTTLSLPQIKNIALIGDLAQSVHKGEGVLAKFGITKTERSISVSQDMIQIRMPSNSYDINLKTKEYKSIYNNQFSLNAISEAWVYLDEAKEAYRNKKDLSMAAKLETIQTNLEKAFGLQTNQPDFFSISKQSPITINSSTSNQTLYTNGSTVILDGHGTHDYIYYSDIKGVYGRNINGDWGVNKNYVDDVVGILLRKSEEYTDKGLSEQGKQLFDIANRIIQETGYKPKENSNTHILVKLLAIYGLYNLLK